MRITFTNDFRTFKKGDVFDFDFKLHPITLIVGANGSGKSTLLNIIRNYKDDTYAASLPWDVRSLNYHFIKDFNKVAIVESKFDKIYHLSSEFDDPFTMNNCGDASMFILSGGKDLNRLSTGQKSLNMLLRFLSKNFGGGIDRLKNIDESILFVFDEIDKGFDLHHQMIFYKMIQKIYNAAQGKISILYVSHTTLPILNTKEVYDIETKCFVSSKDYIRNKTGLTIEIK